MSKSHNQLFQVSMQLLSNNAEDIHYITGI